MNPVKEKSTPISEVGENPLVTIIIPCRNEEKFIGKCLKSILDNDYPEDKLEILIVDGMSDDNTRALAGDYSAKHHIIRIIDNPGKIVPVAMNIGIKNSSGDVIVRMDAHNLYAKDYISKCVKYLREYGVDNVGGVWITLPGSGTRSAKSIALALSHPFAVGNAYYRIGSKEPRYVDTVPFGCYRKTVFERVGMFDEELVRNQDDEFNLRLIKGGGQILLAPDIVSYYFARDSLKKLWKMFFQYGYFKPLVVKKIGGILTLRQLIPAAFVSVLILSFLLSFFISMFSHVFLSTLSTYAIVNLGVSLNMIYRNRSGYPLLPVIFVTIHFAYGLGYLKGIIDFILRGNYRKRDMSNITLTR